MTDELPPLWALDMAAKAARRINWAYDAEGTCLSEACRLSIIAHARTLAKHEPPPVDPAEEQRWKDARKLAVAINNGIWAVTAIQETMRGESDCTAVKNAYAYLCNRDGVTPNLGGGK